MLGFLRRNRSGDEETRIPRKDRTGASPLVVGVVVLALVAVGTYLGFKKDIPFTKGYRVSAVFESSNSIRKNSPVRIAGVNVGKVQKITQYEDTDMAKVEMEITEAGLPLHTDATAKVRPRIFLEGNFFIDLSPGTPGAPTLRDGETINFSRTSSPVQLDEVLTALQDDTREDLQTVLVQLGKAFNGVPAASDDDQDESVKGETAGESLNDTYRDAGPALRTTAIVNEAFLGTEPHDLSKAIKGLQRVTVRARPQRARAPGLRRQLQRDARDLRRREGEPAVDDPPARHHDPDRQPRPRLAEPLLPADARLRPRDPPRRARDGVDDRRLLPVGRARCAGSCRRRSSRGSRRTCARRRATSRIATDASVKFFPQQDLLAKCLSRVVLPTGDIKISDGPFTTGSENYKSFWYTMVGLAGESQNFDGNGQYVRFQTGGGSQTFATGPSNFTQQPSFFRPASPPIGVRPVYPGKRPPYRPDKACYKQQIPNLNSARSGPPDGGNGPAAGGAPSEETGDPTAGIPNVELPSIEIPLPLARKAKRQAAASEARRQGR